MLVQNRPLQSHVPRLWSVSALCRALVLVSFLGTFSITPHAAAQGKSATAKSTEKAHDVKRETDRPAAAEPETDANTVNEIPAAGAETWPTTVRIVAKMRTLPRDNFSYIDPDLAPVRVEVWRQFGQKPKWRVEKPGRVIVMDGASTVALIRPNTAVKIAMPTEGAFDSGLGR